MGQPGSPGSLRLLNAQRIFDLLLADRSGGLSRAEIARMTGLSKPTVSGLVAELEETGIVRAVGTNRSGALGRPALPYEIAADAGFVLAADIGASEIIVGIADLVGTIRVERELKTAGNAGEALKQLAEAAVDLQSQVGALASVATVGVPGVYHQSEGVVGQALNLPGLHGMRVADQLCEKLGIDVYVDNDVNLAARGEASSIEARDQMDFVAISVGTGIGAGLVLSGKLYRGGNDAAGELGGLVITNEPGPDGVVQTLEQVASGPGLEASFRRRLDQGQSSTLERSATVGDILRASAAGDQAASTALAVAGDAMALAVANASLLLNPRRIVFGGDTGANQVFVDAVAAALDRYTTTPIELAASTLGRRATLVGAKMHASDVLQRSIVHKRLAGR